MSTCDTFHVSIRAALVLQSITMIIGCGGAPMEGDEIVDLEESEPIGKADQAIGNTYDVGIIPSSTSCPNGGPLREIYMDDEDHNNTSQVNGWVGATLAGTRFRFCRVDGSKLFPLSTASAVSTNAYYAVLKMGSQCPNGSLVFSRYFDNENLNNHNSALGDIEPSSQSSSGTTLTFCLFKYASPGATTISAFPDFGISYGVFADHRTAFPLAAVQGSVYTDDQDVGNENQYYADPDWIFDAQRIVSSGKNTTLGIARVKVGTWTPWLNRDAPSGAGDYETLADFLLTGQVPCPSPVAVECQTLTGGVNWTQTGQAYTCSPSVGGYCKNVNQAPGTPCLDYKVRFLCL